MSNATEVRTEKYRVDIKKEYTTMLVDRLTPQIFQGIEHLYKQASDADNTLTLEGKTSPGIIKCFQNILRRVPKWNKDMIARETARIRNNTGLDYFENLIKAVIMSNILILTYSSTPDQCKALQKRILDKLDIPTFIHSCYLECATGLYNNAYLFWRNGVSDIDVRRNITAILAIIKKSIRGGIRRMLPMKQILSEFLSNTYIDDDRKDEKDIEAPITESRMQNIRHLVDIDLGKTPKHRSNPDELIVTTERPERVRADTSRAQPLVDQDDSEEIAKQVEQPVQQPISVARPAPAHVSEHKHSEVKSSHQSEIKEVKEVKHVALPKPPPSVARVVAQHSASHSAHKEEKRVFHEAPKKNDIKKSESKKVEPKSPHSSEHRHSSEQHSSENKHHDPQEEDDGVKEDIQEASQIGAKEDSIIFNMDDIEEIYSNNKRRAPEHKERKEHKKS